MSVRTAAIVGAGVGGLAAGVALRRAGWRVRIFERASTPRELGFALSLAPNAIRALEELELAAPVIAAGSILGGVEVRGGDGRLLKRFTIPSGADRTPSVAILRPALLGVLLDATARDSLILGSEATGIQETPSGVALTFRSGRSELADIVVGADGVGSAIRGLIHPGEPPPASSGYYGVRGVAYGVTHLLDGSSAVGYFVRGVEAATLRASADAIYWYMSLLAEDVGETAVPRTLAERHARALDERFRSVLRATADEDLRVDELRERDPLATWGRGRVTLLGDAAHPMLPHTGQGAAQALEDAVALGISLASGEEVAGSLRRYEQVRFRRTRGIVRSGRRIARVTTTKSAGIGWLRAATIRLAPMGVLASAYLLGGRGDPHRALRSPVPRSSPAGRGSPAG